MVHRLAGVVPADLITRKHKIREAIFPNSYRATGGLAIKELHRRHVLKQYLEARKFGFGKAAFRAILVTDNGNFW